MADDELDDEERALLKAHRDKKAAKGHRARVWPDGSAEVVLDDDRFGRLIKKLGLDDDDDQGDDQGDDDDQGDKGKKKGRGWFD